MVGHIMDGKVATEAMASQVSGSFGRFPLFLSGVRVLLPPRTGSSSIQSPDLPCDGPAFPDSGKTGCLLHSQTKP